MYGIGTCDAQTSDTHEYLTVDFEGETDEFDEVMCSQKQSKTNCLARYYLRAFRTAAAFMIGHGQVCQSADD